MLSVLDPKSVLLQQMDKHFQLVMEKCLLLFAIPGTPLLNQLFLPAVMECGFHKSQSVFLLQIRNRHAQ